MAKARPCDNCKRRKTRCFPTPDGSCQFCSRSKSKCTFGGRSPTQNMPSKLSVEPLGKEAPLHYEELGHWYVPDDYTSAAFFGSSSDQDPFLIEHYDKDPDGTHRTLSQGLRVLKSQCATPICFSCVKKPEGSRTTQAMEKLIATHRTKIFSTVEPYKERLLALYFRFIDWNFPAVDRLSFYHSYYYHPDKMHTGLLSAMLALSCIYWKYDTQLCVKPIPVDLAQDLWYLCTLCIDSEMTHPTLQTLQCQLLLLQKRLPRDDSREHFSLATQFAKVVSVCYSLGIHIDCSTWDISDHEKMVRRRLWACAYVIDKWIACSLGRPALFNKHSSNVPSFTSEFPQEQLFVQIYKLTRILDSVMSELYPVDLRYRSDFDISEPGFLLKVDHHLKLLDEWENSLSDDLKDMSAIAVDEDFCRNGILHLDRLCVRSLLLRVYLNPRLMTHPNFPTYRRLAHDHISAIIKFTGEITHSHLHAFWLSSCPLGFSQLAHFVFYYFVQSSEQEQAEISDSVRKWLWAMRVLANTWQEGTGLATLRMDAVFYMGKTGVKIPVPANAKPLKMELSPFLEEELLHEDIMPAKEQDHCFEVNEYEAAEQHRQISDLIDMDQLVHDDLRELLMESWPNTFFQDGQNHHNTHM